MTISFGNLRRVGLLYGALLMSSGRIFRAFGRRRSGILLFFGGLNKILTFFGK